MFLKILKNLFHNLLNHTFIWNISFDDPLDRILPFDNMLDWNFYYPFHRHLNYLFDQILIVDWFFYSPLYWLLNNDLNWLLYDPLYRHLDFLFDDVFVVDMLLHFDLLFLIPNLFVKYLVPVVAIDIPDIHLLDVIVIDRILDDSLDNFIHNTLDRNFDDFLNCDWPFDYFFDLHLNNFLVWHFNMLLDRNFENFFCDDVLLDNMLDLPFVDDIVRNLYLHVIGNWPLDENLDWPVYVFFDDNWPLDNVLDLFLNDLLLNTWTHFSCL